jgi:hypothetical protein
VEIKIADKKTNLIMVLPFFNDCFLTKHLCIRKRGTTKTNRL